MSVRGGQTFEPGDENPLGDLDAAAVQQVGQDAVPNAPDAPVASDGTPLYGAALPAPQEVPLQPTAPPQQPPGAVNQFGSPVEQGGVVNQFGMPTEQPGAVSQYGIPMSPQASGQPGAQTPLGTPASAAPMAPHDGSRIGVAGAPVQSSDAGRPPPTSLYAERSMYGGLVAMVILLIDIFGPGLGIVDILITVAGIATAIYAVRQGHLGLRDVKRGRAGKPQAIAGISMGYAVLLAYVVLIVLIIIAIVWVSNVINTTFDDIPDGDWQDAPASVANAPVVAPTSLLQGDCILYPNDDGTGYIFQKVDCSQPHAGEVLYVSVGENAHPESVSSVEGVECQAAFEPYVQRDYLTSYYWVDLVFPSQARWANGERWAVCYIWYPEYSTDIARASGR